MAAHDITLPAARWRVQLLGGLCVGDGQQQFTRLPSRAIAALLARLVLWPHRAHAREELVELLWPGVPLDVGRNRLRQALSTLKSVLEPAGADAVLLADRMAVRVVPGALACDVVDFEAAALRGDAAQALALYAGELLPGHYDDWICDERQRLASLAETLAELPAGPARVAPAKAPAGTASPATSGPFTPAAVPARSRLPHYLTRLLGAEANVLALREGVCAHRLVTLLGPGGAGKTRLAVELAHQLSASVGNEPPPFDTVVFVSLVACQDARALGDALLLAVAPASSGALHVEPVLEQALAGQRALLVLDNFEQLVGGAGDLLARLVQQLPGLHLLVTSRRTLGLDGEVVVPLAALALPQAQASLQALAQNPAVALFVDRARAARADFHLHEQNAQALGQLVHALEGLPLAIELAAARVRSLAPAQLLALLLQARQSPLPGPAHGLLARSGSRAGHDPRHASMQAVVNWSWQLLSPAAREQLMALTVVPAGCTLPAAAALAGQDTALAALALDELVSHSLLRTAGEPLRFEHYELVREFAAQQLQADQGRQLRERLRQWFTRWGSSDAAHGPLTPWRQELPNLTAALALAPEEGAADAAVAMLLALRGALSDLSLPAQAMALAAACAQACSDPDLAAQAHAFLARASFRAGRRDEADRHAACAGQRLPAAPGSRAQVLSRLAHVQWRMRKNAAAVQPMLQEALQLAQQEGLVGLQASVLSTLGAVARQQGSLQAAIALQRQALALWQRAGDPHGQNTGRLNLALAMSSLPAERDDALGLVDDTLRDAAALDDWLQYGTAANLRGELLSWQRRWAGAAEAYRDGIRAAHAAMEPMPVAYCLWNLPGALAHLRQAEVGAQLMGFAYHHWQAHFAELTVADRHDARRVRRLLQCSLAPGTVAALWRQGAGLSLAQAVALASQANPP